MALFIASELLSTYDDLQLASGSYYFVVLAGLTVLTGLSGQISLGHGALMAVGAYTVALLVGNEHWPLRARAGRRRSSRSARGDARRRRRHAPARPLPRRRDARVRDRTAGARGQVPGTFGGENGLTINPPTPPSGLGASFPLERWEAWIAGAGALVVCS